MRVVCDNCGASYKIPDEKLTKEVNKATCRKCGNAIFIKRAGEAAARPADTPLPIEGEERTLITNAAELERAARARAGSASDQTADSRLIATSPSPEHGGDATIPRMGTGASASADPASADPKGVAPAPTFPPSSAPARPAPVEALPLPPPPRLAAPVVPPPAISPVSQAAPFPPKRPGFPPPAAAPPSAAPAPVFNSAALTAGAAFDPRSDLSMALGALVVTVIGVLVLALSSWLGSPVVTGLGAFLALFGTFFVALVLVTGGRGTRGASLGIAFVGGLLLSGGFAYLLSTGSHLFAPDATVADAADDNPGAAVDDPVGDAVLQPDPAVAEPVVEPAVVDVAPVDPAPVEPAAHQPASALAQPVASTRASAPREAVSKPPGAMTSTNTSTSRTASSAPSDSTGKAERIAPKNPASSASKAGTTTGTTATAAATAAPAPASPSPSAAPAGVSDTVIDTMIKSNKAVKSCFVQQRNETGELPKGVKVKLTIQPAGKVSSAALPSGALQGSTFDSCLSAAIKSIQFPPFDGVPVSVTYPFSI